MTAGRTYDLALPAAALTALRQTLIAELGAARAAEVLRQAGHAAGEALYHSLQQAGGGEAQLGEDQFWKRFAQVFATRGWGNLASSLPHPGVGALDTVDWSEADPNGSARRPSCFFTTGMLANLLGAAAGSEVAVMEVECRSRGDGRCRFLYGSPAALDGVYQHMVAGEGAEQALAQLG